MSYTIDHFTIWELTLYILITGFVVIGVNVTITAVVLIWIVIISVIGHCLYIHSKKKTYTGVFHSKEDVVRRKWWKEIISVINVVYKYAMHPILYNSYSLLITQFFVYIFAHMFKCFVCTSILAKSKYIHWLCSWMSSVR